MPNFFDKYPYTDFHELNLDWIIKTVKETVAEWAVTLTEWHNTQEEWQQLYDYVHDFFDTLNLQEEVNIKINGMIEDGSFETIAIPIINAKVADMLPSAVSAQIGGTVAGQIDAVVASQIDAVVASQITTEVSTAASAWLADHITNPSNPPIDTSLTIGNAAADAKVTGDIVNQIVIYANFSNTGTAFTYSGLAGGSVSQSTNVNYSYTDPISIKKGDKIIFNVKTDNAYVSPMTQVLEDNSLRALIAGQPGTREETYTAVSDMDVILCGRTDGSPFAIIRGTIITEGVFDPVADEVDAIKEFTDEIEPCFGDVNLLTHAIIKPDMMLNTSTGAEQAATSGYYLHIVDVVGGQTYYWTQLGISIYQAAVYDENDALIDFLYNLGWHTWNSYFTLPANAVKAKMVVNTAFLATKYFGTMYPQWQAGVTKYLTDKLYIPDQDFITIGTGGDYSTITAGFAAATAAGKGAIILPGTYDLVSEGVSGIGLVCPKHVKGYGALIKMILPSEDWDLSALNMPQSSECIIEGVDVEVTNGRYCIHDEMYSFTGAYHHVIKNCRLVHNSPISSVLIAPRAIGGGIGNAGSIEIYNNYIESKVSYGDAAYHSNGLGTQSGNVYVHVHDNDIAHAVQFNSIGSSTAHKNIAYISNNRFGLYVPTDADTANMKQICWNNVLA